LSEDFFVLSKYAVTLVFWEQQKTGFVLESMFSPFARGCIISIIHYWNCRV